MNKLEELEINVEALLYAVSDDKKFFASIYQFVEKLNLMLTKEKGLATKEKILFLSTKIEEFFAKDRSIPGTLYSPPAQIDKSDDNVKNIYSLAQELSSLENSQFNELIQANKPPVKATKKAFDKSKIFIVHGHDNETKIEVARFIEKLGFEAIILHEQASAGKTMIEKIESYSDVGFAVVLYTPDDMGAVVTNKDEFNYRARQNVVFEHGFLIGKLGREKVSTVVKGDIELPNDISGVVYVTAQNWQTDLAKELSAAGYNIDFNKLFKQSRS